MSTTKIENLKNTGEQSVIVTILDQDNLPLTIMDFSIELDTRIRALNDYYKKNGDDIIGIISTISGMYQMSGTKILEQYLYRICTHSSLSSFLRLEAAKSLLIFEELEEDSESDDSEELQTIKLTSNKKIQERNTIRSVAAYKALDCVCYDLDNTPTPCRVDAVCLLMGSPNHQKYSESYFKELISDDKIECDFRYKTILSLERKDILTPYYFLEKACLEFIFYDKNMIFYRILAGQYLLQKCDLGINIKNKVEQQLLEFAQDNDLDYDRRADAADVLLQLGSDSMKDLGREVIMLLGRVGGEVKTIFDNAQNVHTDEVEESVLEVLEFLAGLPLLQIGGNDITFDYVQGQIEKILKDSLKKYRTTCVNSCEHTKCSLCNSCVDDPDDYQKKLYCNISCIFEFQKQEKIRIALNRINIDRALYSKFNNTLVNILLKVWSYMSGNDSEEQMRARLLQELVDMSGTCSSGFSTRLVNSITGFGEFNIRISWEDQITANLGGRLNARARDIINKDSQFYSTKSDDVVELWLNAHIDVKKKVALKLAEKENRNPAQIPVKEIVTEYKNSVTLEKCVGEFAENVLNEMMVSSSKFNQRQNFLLFFRTYVSSIREELYKEFKDLIKDDHFDLSFRKAIINYEGAN